MGSCSSASIKLKRNYNLQSNFSQLNYNVHQDIASFLDDKSFLRFMFVNQEIRQTLIENVLHDDVHPPFPIASTYPALAKWIFRNQNEVWIDSKYFRSSGEMAAIKKQRQQQRKGWMGGKAERQFSDPNDEFLMTNNTNTNQNAGNTFSSSSEDDDDDDDERRRKGRNLRRKNNPNDEGGKVECGKNDTQKEAAAVWSTEKNYELNNEAFRNQKITTILKKSHITVKLAMMESARATPEELWENVGALKKHKANVTVREGHRVLRKYLTSVVDKATSVAAAKSTAAIMLPKFTFENSIAYNSILSQSQFFTSFRNLISIDLQNLFCGAKIGDMFLAHCMNLVHVKLPQQLLPGERLLDALLPIPKASRPDLTISVTCREIGKLFLSDEAKLTFVDLSPLYTIETIGGKCFEGCASLTYFDMQKCTMLKTIGTHFAANCLQLREVDLSCCVKLTSIDDSCLVRCLRLEKVKIFPTVREKVLVPSIQNQTSDESHKTNDDDEKREPLLSLSDTTAAHMTTSNNNRQQEEPVKNSYVPNTTASSLLSSIGDYCLMNCHSLRELNLSYPAPALSSIGHHFMTDNHALTHLDLSGLSRLSRLEDAFLQGCENLVNVNFSGLKSVASIGSRVLQGCHSIETIDLSSMINLTRIGASVMMDCMALRHVILPNATASTTTENKDVDETKKTSTTPMQSIGAFFLMNNIQLRKITNLSSLSHLSRRQVGDLFLGGCMNLVYEERDLCVKHLT